MIVNVEHLTHQYGQRTALADLSFSVPKGVIFGVLGPNGGGKSTLFSILSTLLHPTGGSVTVDGIDALKQPALVRRRIGVVFQNQSLDRKLTVEENLISQGRLYGWSGKGLRERVTEVLERFRLSDRRAALVDSLSGGLKRRTEIAKALLHQPAVILMDEPSTGLDPGARRDLWQYIQELRATYEATVLLTTHLLDEADRCDQLLLLHGGKKVVEGTPAALKARVGGDVVVLETTDPQGIATALKSRFHASVSVIDGAVRVEIVDGHRFVAEAVEAFPGQIQSVALHKPTLEDVFLDETGVRIES